MSASVSAKPFLRASIIIPFALVTLIWGSTWLVIKAQFGAVPPSWSVTWRFALAAAAMFALAFARRERLRLSLREQGLTALVGVIQFAVNFQLLYSSERYLTSGLVAVMFALMMVPNALLAQYFLGQRVTRGFAIGSAVAIAGIALLIIHEYRMAPPSGQVMLGLGLALASIASASSSNVLQASGPLRRIPGLSMLAWAMLWGTLANAVMALVLSGPPVFDSSPGYLAGVAWLALAGSVVTFPLYLHLLRELGPGKAAYTGVAVPIIAMALSTLFEDYRWSMLAVLGAVVALCGLLIALSSRE